MAEWVSEETAQALARSIDALAERLGRIESVLDEQGPVGSLLVQRQESFDNIAKALEQLASGNMPEIVRIAASLSDIKERLPDLEYIVEGVWRVVQLREELQAIPRAAKDLNETLYAYREAIGREIEAQRQQFLSDIGRAVERAIKQQEELATKFTYDMRAIETALSNAHYAADAMKEQTGYLKATVTSLTKYRNQR